MALVYKDLGPYVDGVNLTDPLVLLTPNELSRCLNFRTGNRGNFYKRPGHDNYGSSPAKVNGDNIVTLILRYYRADGTKKTIAAAGGKLRYGNDVTGAWTDISINGTGASMHSSNLADWMVYKNRLYITDGTQPQRYNGTDDLFAGHYVYGAPSLAQAVGGNLTLLATYKYIVASIASDMGEGKGGTVGSFTLSGANNQINLTGMTAPAGTYEESTKKIYRTKANGSTYYLLTEIATGTTTFNDTLGDNSLGAEYIPVHAPQADTRYVIIGHDERAYWFGRTSLANASTVEVSDVGFPDRVPDTSFFTVNNNDGDICTGAGLIPGGIIFFKKTSMWLQRAFGYGLINIQPREKKGGGVGTTSPFSVVSTPIGLIFLSQRGEVYLFDGTNLTEIGRKIATEFRGMTSTAMGNIIACYHDYRYIISYDYRSIKGYNWRTLEYDTRDNKWEGPHENKDFYTPSYYSVWDSVLDHGELYWGEAKAANGSFIYGRGEFSKTDRGNKFVSEARPGAIVNGLGEVKYTKIFIHGDFSSDATLKASLIDEINRVTNVDLNSPTASNNAIYNKNKYNDGSKYGGRTSKVLSGSFETTARSRAGVLAISDNGTATEASMNLIRLQVIPLEP